MFRTVFSSIVRSSKQNVWQQLLLPTASSSCLTHACCCMCSFGLQTMDEKTVRNM